MKALVTGGGGFLGGAIARWLRQRGDEVHTISRGDYPELAESGIRHFRGDLGEIEVLKRATEGCAIVYHVAAKAGIWGPGAEYHRANVAGTANVLAACRQLGIGCLVYTSSPSVVFDGSDMEGVDESAPYPDRYETHYPKTKAIAERMVLEANGDSLATVALRPHLIWGPGDNHLVPRIWKKGKAGQLRRIGRRDNKVDSVYIDNAAEAHVLAGDRLEPGAPHAGHAYFISNGEPLPVWDLVDAILAAADIPPVKRAIPAGVAYTVGAVLEGVYKLFRIRSEPRITRFVARELATAHWFDISAAQRDFGYKPRVTIEEGLKRLREDYLKRTGVDVRA